MACLRTVAALPDIEGMTSLYVALQSSIIKSPRRGWRHNKAQRVGMEITQFAEPRHLLFREEEERRRMERQKGGRCLLCCFLRNHTHRPADMHGDFICVVSYSIGIVCTGHLANVLNYHQSHMVFVPRICEVPQLSGQRCLDHAIQSCQKLRRSQVA